jgi:hypothetical protein
MVDVELILRNPHLETIHLDVLGLSVANNVGKEKARYNLHSLITKLMRLSAFTNLSIYHVSTAKRTISRARVRNFLVRRLQQIYLYVDHFRLLSMLLHHRKRRCYFNMHILDRTRSFRQSSNNCLSCTVS